MVWVRVFILVLNLVGCVRRGFLIFFCLVVVCGVCLGLFIVYFLIEYGL